MRQASCAPCWTAPRWRWSASTSRTRSNAPKWPRQLPGTGLSGLNQWKESLADDSIVLVASEGANIESLDQTEALVDAGKHVWYDKPAGQNWEQWQRVVETARGQGTQLQMGYMFRYHEGFCQVADWVRSGFLGDVYGLRAHMSTNVGEEQRHRARGTSGWHVLRLGQPHAGPDRLDVGTSWLKRPASSATTTGIVPEVYGQHRGCI